MFFAIVNPVGDVQRDIVGGGKVEQIPKIKQPIGSVLDFLLLPLFAVLPSTLQRRLRLVIANNAIVAHLGGDVFKV